MVDLIKDEYELAHSIMRKVNLKKDDKGLQEHLENLSHEIVNLSKTSKINLGGHIARVAVVIDYSYSMAELYKDGTVQDTLNKMIPFGLMFDDNGEVDVYTFSNNSRKHEGMDIDNYYSYVEQVIKPNTNNMGGTNYASAIKDIDKDYFGKSKGIFGKFKKEKDLDTPVFVIFITDGDNSDKKDTESIIRKLADKNVFIQFIGIGDAKFDFLEELDDLDGRSCDNTGFVKFSDLNNVSDEEFYHKALKDYPQWLKDKNLGQILED